MPQKLNRAGKMQDYIPAGNGDPSGEYGTSKGTNKNFTASDKKKTEANVIKENKSVKIENKSKGLRSVKNGESDRYLLPDEWEQVYYLSKKANKKMDKMVDELYRLQDKKGLGTKNAIKELEVKYSEKDNKANVINNDLTGKKEDAPKGKSATRKDKYGNNLVSDEAFKIGYEAGKKALEEELKYYDKETLLKSNVFLGGLEDAVSEAITDAGLNNDYNLTYQDFNEIVGAVLDKNISYEDYSRNGTKGVIGQKYTGYKPKGLK